MVNHRSQQVIEEISFGTPIYGPYANEIFVLLEHAKVSIQGRKNDMVCKIVQELYISETNRKRNTSQETTSEKGVISESFQISRRPWHKFFSTNTRFTEKLRKRQWSNLEEKSSVCKSTNFPKSTEVSRIGV